MNILVFGMTENPGGVESVIMNYFRHMDPAGFHMDFLCNTPTVAYEEELKARGSQVIKIPMRSKDAKAYKKAMDDFFSAHGSEYDAIWVNVCSLANIDYLKYAKKAGIPIRIIHSHNSANMDSKARAILHHLNKTRIDKYANVFWSCSQSSSDWFYSDAIQKSKTYRLINNAIDMSVYAYNPKVRQEKRRELGIGEHQLVVGHTGRLHFQKNQTFLLEIFASILEKRPDALLLLAGDGEDEAMLKEKAGSLGIADKVRFLGVRKDVPALLQAMDVFVFPSVFEGWGLSLLEAQAASLPCFASADVIPADIKMSDHVTFIPLSQPPAVWADTILKSDLERKARNVAGIAQAGYDIEKESQKLASILRGFKDEVYHS